MDEDKHRAKADSLFGQIALKLGLITRKQLDDALELQKYAKERKPVGVILMELKIIGQAELEKIIEAQKELVVASHSRAKAVKEDNLFGKVAIRLGFSDETQLQECLKMQETLPKERFMRLGDIMVLKGYLSVEQVRSILDAQKGLILFCPHCKTQFNVVMLQPGATLQCYNCGSPLRIPTVGSA
jgi:hypothetical protein